MARAASTPATREVAMHVSLLLCFLLLVAGPAHADEPMHAVAGASGPDRELVRPGVADPQRELEDATFARMLDVRVAEVLDRAVERMAERVVSALEARETERLGEGRGACGPRVREPDPPRRAIPLALYADPR